MNIYLAARYSRRLELCAYREQLIAMGHEVTSRWLDGNHQIDSVGTPIGDNGEALVESGSCQESARLRAKFAFEDLIDALEADCVISFTEPPRSSASRGGRHVEFGIGLALSMRSIVIGHRENIFHWLAEIEFYETWDKCLDHLKHELNEPVMDVEGSAP